MVWPTINLFRNSWGWKWEFKYSNYQLNILKTKELIKWHLEEEVLADHAKCTKQFALIVVQKQKFRSNPPKVDQSIVETATRNIENIRAI